nr:PKD domain-containing protein [Candidatus Sigynarchaeota archaeon]
GECIHFTFVGCMGVPPAILEWNFGDASVNTTAITIDHTYISPGNFTVSLKVQDATGLFDIAQNNGIIVEEEMYPVADFGMNTTTCYVDEQVNFFSNGTPGNNPSRYAWTFVDDSSISSNQSVTHSFSRIGNFTITLVVMDRDGDTSTKSRTVTVITKEIIDTIPPTITFCTEDISCELGEDIDIRVVFFDSSGSGSCKVLVNAFEYPWSNMTWISGISVEINVDTSRSGLFNYTFYFEDGNGVHGEPIQIQVQVREPEEPFENSLRDSAICIGFILGSNIFAAIAVLHFFQKASKKRKA